MIPPIRPESDRSGPIIGGLSAYLLPRPFDCHIHGVYTLGFPAQQRSLETKPSGGFLSLISEESSLPYLP